MVMNAEDDSKAGAGTHLSQSRSPKQLECLQKKHTLQNQTHSYWCHFVKDKQIQSIFRAEEQWLIRCQNSFPASSSFAHPLEYHFLESL